MMALVMLSISAVAFENDPYSLDEAEVPVIYVLDESLGMEYLQEASVMGAVNDNYGVGTSNTAIFAGVARKLPFGVNYVYWRASRYEYVFAYGSDLKLNGTTFTADNVNVITYNTNVEPQSTFTLSTETNFSLSANNYLVWSSLGHYPSLDDGGGIYAKTSLAVLVGFGVFYFVSRIMRRCFS